LREGKEAFRFEYSKDFLRAVKAGNLLEVAGMVKVFPEIVLSYDHVSVSHVEVGQTGVHYAILRNHVGVLAFLLRNFAPKDDPCENGIRPIDLALREKNHQALVVG
jgi:hypothetical protein